MKSEKLRFESVADVNFKYCYIFIYDKVDMMHPFMKIGITDEQELVYTIYSDGSRLVELTSEDWDCISRVAKEFLPEEIAREEYCEQWMKEWGIEE